MSQKDLSVALNKGFNYINSIEGGVSFPPPAVIDQIAAILNIEAEALFSSRASPQNIAAAYMERHGVSLRDEMLRRVCQAVGSLYDDALKLP